jgi:hypothetical protein
LRRDWGRSVAQHAQPGDSLEVLRVSRHELRLVENGGRRDRRSIAATRKLVCELPEGGVTVRRDLPWHNTGGRELTFDIYQASTAERPVPAVLLVTGYPDAGVQRMRGCNAKDVESYDGWGRLLAASGLAAIGYVNHEPVADAHAILAHVRRNAPALGIDAARIGVWACSGNVPNALSLLIEASPRPACAALCYGYMLDLDGSTAVADAAGAWRFVNPCEGLTLGDMPVDVPIFIARAGCDETAGLNDSIDRFVSKALGLNRPISLVNRHTAPHAFDTVDDSDASRAVIRQLLEFLRETLSAQD